MRLLLLILGIVALCCVGILTLVGIHAVDKAKDLQNFIKTAPARASRHKTEDQPAMQVNNKPEPETKVETPAQ